MHPGSQICKGKFKYTIIRISGKTSVITSGMAGVALRFRGLWLKATGLQMNRFTNHTLHKYVPDLHLPEWWQTLSYFGSVIFMKAMRHVIYSMCWTF